MIDLTQLITAQRDLQLKLGNDTASMTPEEKIEFIRLNVLACVDELHEALGETGWKPWASSRHINEGAFFGELRDAWQFLTNMMLCVFPEPDELAKHFASSLTDKLAVNHRRADGGYDGVNTKCQHCGRALEDVVIEEVRLEGGTTVHHCACGQSLSSTIVQLLIGD